MKTMTKMLMTAVLAVVLFACGENKQAADEKQADTATVTTTPADTATVTTTPADTAAVKADTAK